LPCEPDRVGAKEEPMRRIFQTLLVIAVLLAGAAMASELQPPPEGGLKVATFAGGCFWCMVPPFEKMPGVAAVISGYTGGSVPNATYEQVSAGGTGHAEAVQVVYDPAKVSYGQLLYVFWRNVDPLTKDRQFCDEGHQYRTAIFTSDDAQRKEAEASRAEIQKRFGDKPVVTEIVPAGPFWRAEEYHQDYYKKKPLQYAFYRFNCGRDARLKQLWGDEAGGGTEH
jgi:peptide-methionine (S)-S-oxide reductase